MSISTFFIAATGLFLIALGFDDLCVWAKTVDGLVIIIALPLLVGGVIYVGLGESKKHDR